MDKNEPIAIKKTELGGHNHQWNLYAEGDVIMIERAWNAHLATFLAFKYVTRLTLYSIPTSVLWDLIDLIKDPIVRDTFITTHGLVRPDHLYEPCRLIAEKYFAKDEEGDWKTSYLWRLYSTGEVIYTEQTWDDKWPSGSTSESITRSHFNHFLTPELLWEMLDTAHCSDREAFIKRFTLTR